VRRYTKNTMVDIKGPVTVVSGASRSFLAATTSSES